MIVFNTTGSGFTPSTDTLQTNWARVFVRSVDRAGQRRRLVRPRPSNSSLTGTRTYPPGVAALGTTPQQFSYNLNSNGTGTEFSILAQKAIFKGIASPSAVSQRQPIGELDIQRLHHAGRSSQAQWFVLWTRWAPGGPVDPQFVSPTLDMTEVLRQHIFRDLQPGAGSGLTDRQRRNLEQSRSLSRVRRTSMHEAPVECSHDLCNCASPGRSRRRGLLQQLLPPRHRGRLGIRNLRLRPPPMRR